MESVRDVLTIRSLLKIKQVVYHQNVLLITKSEEMGVAKCVHLSCKSVLIKEIVLPPFVPIMSKFLILDYV